MTETFAAAPDWPSLQRESGKVRDAYRLRSGERLLVTTDRQSAFDAMIGTVPHKGEVLNQLSAWWFRQTEAEVPNHLLAVEAPNAMRVRDCRPLPVEFVMRGYLAGVTSTSIWTAYARGDRSFCGHPLPDGLALYDALPEPLLTPSTKAAQGGHDASLSRDAILATGVVSAADFDAAAAYAQRLFALGQARAKARGLLLVDTKYEFGFDAQGTLRLIDELHTPDSSRYWLAEDYATARAEGRAPRGLDKEYLRRWLKAEGFSGEGPVPPFAPAIRQEATARYIEAFTRLTGEAFVPSGELAASLDAALRRLAPPAEQA